MSIFSRIFRLGRIRRMLQQRKPPVKATMMPDGRVLPVAPYRPGLPASAQEYPSKQATADLILRNKVLTNALIGAARPRPAPPSAERKDIK